MPTEGESTIPAHDALWVNLVGSVPFYLAIFSLDGRLRFLNRTRGPDPPVHFVGQTLGELFPNVPGAESMIGRVVESGRPLEVELVGALLTGTQTIATHLTPIVESGKVTGVLGVGVDVTEAKQASIELRMSVNALHRLLEEREQMAADLHDGILQSLYGVGLRLEAARVAARSGAVSDQHMDRAIAQLNDTMTEIRRFLDVGRSSLAVNADWEDTFIGVLRSLTADGGPALTIELDPSATNLIPIADRSDTVFIAREAVSNAVRHSRAQRVNVRLFEEHQTVRLQIEDDGQGFSAEGRGPAAGLGLLTMTRRAGRMGAVLTIQSAPGAGTKVHLDMAVAKGGS